MHQPIKPEISLVTQPAPRQRPHWWLGLGIVLGSLASYWITYNVTQSTTKQWFVIPLEDAQASPQSASALPQTAYAERPAIAGEKASNQKVNGIEAAILAKKNYFDTQADEYGDRLSALETNQTEILRWSERLEEKLTVLAALPSPERVNPERAHPGHTNPEADIYRDTVSKLAEVVQQLSTLASQGAELQSANQTPLSLRQQAYEQIRLLEQIEVSKRGAEKHATLALHFHSQGKASVIVSLVLGIAAGSLGVLISREGWDKSDNRLIYSFALLSTMALFFNQLPRVLQSEINFQNNRDIYLGYLTLRNNIHTFVATEKGIGVDPDAPDRFGDLQTNRFIHSVDAKLAELNQLRIGIDANQRVDISTVLNIPTR